jgi:hypothetical protein
VALLHLCEALGERVAQSPSLDLARVQAVEAELGCALPDDVLVVLAVRSSILECATNLSLDEILEVGDDVWTNGVPEDHVAIAAVYHEPFAERYEGAHGGPYDVIAIPRTSSSPSILVVSDGRPHDEPTTLAAFAREKIAAWYRRRDEWIRCVETAGQPWDRRFAPRLSGAPAKTATAPERWVTHPKLGRGRLLEMRDDKFTVAFDSGTKVLKSSMLVLEDAPKVETPPQRPRVSGARSHVLWEEFASRLAKAGVDATRGFFEQADQSKGHDADGHAYRRRDADGRARTTLRVLKELTGVKLPSSYGYEESASESWPSESWRSPEHCFESATR